VAEGRGLGGASIFRRTRWRILEDPAEGTEADRIPRAHLPDSERVDVARRNDLSGKTSAARAALQTEFPSRVSGRHGRSQEPIDDVRETPGGRFCPIAFMSFKGSTRSAQAARRRVATTGHAGTKGGSGHDSGAHETRELLWRVRAADDQGEEHPARLSKVQSRSPPRWSTENDRLVGVITFRTGQSSNVIEERPRRTSRRNRGVAREEELFGPGLVHPRRGRTVHTGWLVKLATAFWPPRVPRPVRKARWENGWNGG